MESKGTGESRRVVFQPGMNHPMILLKAEQSRAARTSVSCAFMEIVGEGSGGR